MFERVESGWGLLAGGLVLSLLAGCAGSGRSVAVQENAGMDGSLSAHVQTVEGQAELAARAARMALEVTTQAMWEAGSPQAARKAFEASRTQALRLRLGTEALGRRGAALWLHWADSSDAERAQARGEFDRFAGELGRLLVALDDLHDQLAGSVARAEGGDCLEFPCDFALAEHHERLARVEAGAESLGVLGDGLLQAAGPAAVQRWSPAPAR